MVLEPNYPEEEFEEYVTGRLQTIAPGDAYPGDRGQRHAHPVIERVERISELVEQYGNYPIKPEALPA